MPKVILASQSSKDTSNVAANPERLINWIAERVNVGGKTSITLRSVPGQVAWGDTETVLLRDMKTVFGILYVVAAGGLYTVDSSGSAVLLGAIADDVDTVIDGNGTSVTITAGGNYYVWNGTTLTQPSGGLLTSFGSVGFMGQFTVITEKGGNRFEWTALADPETRNGLNFATCESNNDDVVRVIPHKNYIWLFNEESTEIWYQTGAAGADAFAPLAGGALDVGIKSVKLGVSFSGGIFFVGHDDVVYLAGSDVFQPKSTPAVETAIGESTPTHVTYYEFRGHKVCVIRFNDRPAWCYDFTTNLWHERASGVIHQAWESVVSEFAYGAWRTGTEAGKIYEMTGTTDVDRPLRRTLVSVNFYQAGNRFSVPEFEALGVFGETETLAYDPLAGELTDQFGEIITDDFGETIYAGALIPQGVKIMARFSKNGGRSYGGEKVRDIGKVGERHKRAVWRGLGQFRELTVELSITDDVDIPLYGEANLVTA